jgi:hypothetical protein
MEVATNACTRRELGATNGTGRAGEIFGAILLENPTTREFGFRIEPHSANSALGELP